jgi:(2Fe-2S) ferredoxin
MPAFEHHVFVCCNKTCDPGGQEELRSRIKKELKRRGLKPRVRANSCGCLDQCELGPTVVIYPQGIWYGRVKPSDAERIVEETIVNGRILDDLLIPDSLLNSGEGWP